MSKYVVDPDKLIIKSTTLYSGDKTQVPKKVIKMLNLKRGSQIIWIKNGDQIIVTNNKVE